MSKKVNWALRTARQNGGARTSEQWRAMWEENEKQIAADATSAAERLRLGLDDAKTSAH